jgi:putative component of membrane protein insertase Oxa1/YidC/SpoIIIJ protein YidD
MKKSCIPILFIFCIFTSISIICNAQSINNAIITNINAQINANHIEPKRKFLKKDSVFWKNLLPTRYVFGTLLFVYQNAISEQISANCAYEMSCSEFSKNSISKFGFIKGILLSGNRLCSCGTNTIIDFPEYKKTEQFKIAHDFEDY